MHLSQSSIMFIYLLPESKMHFLKDFHLCLIKSQLTLGVSV